MTINELREYIKLGEDATPGPWDARTVDGQHVVSKSRPLGGNGSMSNMSVNWTVFNGSPQDGECGGSNAAFIAASRTIGPEAARLLVEAVDILREVLGIEDGWIELNTLVRAEVFLAQFEEE